jgi:hypothetical protein
MRADYSIRCTMSNNGARITELRYILGSRKFIPKERRKVTNKCCFRYQFSQVSIRRKQDDPACLVFASHIRSYPCAY